MLCINEYPVYFDMVKYGRLPLSFLGVHRENVLIPTCYLQHVAVVIASSLKMSSQSTLFVMWFHFLSFSVKSTYHLFVKFRIKKPQIFLPVACLTHLRNNRAGIRSCKKVFLLSKQYSVLLHYLLLSAKP